MRVSFVAASGSTCRSADHRCSWLPIKFTHVRASEYESSGRMQVQALFVTILISMNYMLLCSCLAGDGVEPFWLSLVEEGGCLPRRMAP